jgi:hypothetical protein
LEPGPPALAPCGSLPHAGAANGLAGRRPDRHRTARTLAASRPRTPRPGANLARPAGGRGAPGLTGRPVHRRGAPGGRTRSPDARPYPPTAHAFFGGDAGRLCQWAAASARQPAHAGQYPGASGSRRRRRGVPVSSARQSAPATAPGNAPRRAPGQQWASARPALHTGSPGDGQRHTCPSRRCGHGPGMQGLQVGHGPAGGRAAARLKMTGCCQTSLRGFHPLAEAAQPRCGVTLGSVQRPHGPLVPRVRQAPDGGKEGGTQPTDSSVINRRVFLAPPPPIDKKENLGCRRKKVAPNP